MYGHPNHALNKAASQRILYIVRVVLGLIAELRGVLSNRDLDTLLGKLLAQGRAFDDAGKLLGRIYLEWLGEDHGEDWGFALVQRVTVTLPTADVDEVHSQPTLVIN